MDENKLKQIILPPPLSKITSLINDRDQKENIPGNIIVSASGKLLKTSLEYSGFSADILANYDKLMINIIPTRIKSEIIPFKNIRKHGINTEIIFSQVTIVSPHLGSSKSNPILTPMMARDFNYSYFGFSSNNYSTSKTITNQKIVT